MYRGRPSKTPPRVRFGVLEGYFGAESGDLERVERRLRLLAIAIGGRLSASGENEGLGASF